MLLPTKDHMNYLKFISIDLNDYEDKLVLVQGDYKRPALAF